MSDRVVVLSDPARLDAVRRLLRTSSPEGLDRLTGLAAMLLRAPSAQVSLLSEEQHIAAGVGLAVEPQGSSPAAESLCHVTVELGGPLAVGDATQDPRVQSLPPVLEGGVKAYLGVPLTDRAGLVVGALCVHDVQVRTWTAADVAILSELAASVVAELELLALTQELAAGAAHVELAMSAAGAGSFQWDIDSGRLLFDDRLVELFGHTREAFDGRIESFIERIHPDDAERTGAALAAGVERGGELALDYRVLRPDGSVRRVIGRGRVVGRNDRDRGSFIGVAYDATEQLDTRDRLAQVLTTMSDAFLSVDQSWRVTWLNAEAERLIGRGAADVTGKTLADALPQLLADQVVAHCRPAMHGGAPVAFEQHDEQTGRFYEVRAWPQPDGLALSLLDVTARRQAEGDRERASQEREQAVVERERAYAAAATATTRLAVLADATTRLSASLEPRQVLQALADAVVPALGAWLAVVMSAELAGTLGDESQGDGDLRVVLARHGQPGRSEELTVVLQALSLDLLDERGPGAVLRTGRADALPAPDADVIAALVPDPDRASRLVALGLGPSLTLPLSSRGRRLATMTVVAPAHDVLDATLLADLAGRAAVALDNALLYGDERRTGLTLQRSLLPREVPQLPDIELAVRYLPGATGAHVGGDWYQGLQVDGGLVLAIGDVMGHGMHSAARMGQLRAIVATLALEGHPPGELLSRLAANVDALLDLELATLLVARYDPQARTLSLASAGHPPLLHAPMDREPYYVDLEPGPPLGTFPGTYRELVVPLAERDTVVLFTDGLIESRGADLDTGLERLRQALVELRLPPEAVADHVLHTMGVTSGGADDIALLVLSHGSLH